MADKPLALIIEDDEDQNLVFTKALEQAGFATVSINDGVTAMASLGKMAPAVVVLDLHMPGINGGFLLREIRRDPFTAQTRVIIATADAELASMLEAQADFVLIKPISFSQLSQLARRLIPAAPA